MRPVRSAFVFRAFLSSGVFGCALLLGACASSSASSEGASAPAPEAKEVPVQDEVPNVNQCHTDTGSCPLPEPLQPGLGCFCDKEDGTKEAGTAGS